MKSEHNYIAIFEICSTTIKSIFATRNSEGLIFVHNLIEAEGEFLHRGILTNIDKIKFEIVRNWQLLNNSCQKFSKAYLTISNANDKNYLNQNQTQIDQLIEFLLNTKSIDLTFINNPQTQMVNLLTTPEERKNGCLFVDFGAGCTHVQCIVGNKTILCNSIPVGSQDITNDIASDLNIKKNLANTIKIKCGTADAMCLTKSCLKIHQGDKDIVIFNTDLASRIESRLTTDCILKYVNPLQQAGIFDKNNIQIVVSGGGSKITDLDHLFMRLCKASGIRKADTTNFIDENCKEYNRPELHSLICLLYSAELIEVPSKRFFKFGTGSQDQDYKKTKKKKEKTSLDTHVDNLMDKIWND